MKKNASKMLVALMVLTMSFGLVACSQNEYVGTWKATSATVKGVSIDLATYGLDMSMVLEANGKVTVSLSSDQGSGTWKKTDKGISISSDGQTLTANKTSDGKLELLEPASGATMYFEKQPN